MRKALLMGTVGIALVSGLAVPASAADPVTTNATFTLTSAGGLNITAPETADLGTSVDIATGVNASLGTVTVTDSTGSFLGGWVAQVSTEGFVTPHDTTAPDAPTEASTLDARTILPEEVAYATGVIAFLPSVGTFVPAAAGPIGGGRTVATASATIGSTQASWAPTITIQIPADAPIGAYSGTITHSVA